MLEKEEKKFLKVQRKMSECIFCDIIEGKLPCNKIYEDENVLAFLDINPVNKGHTLIIPKKHSETVLDTDDNILKEFILVIKKVSKAVYGGLELEGFNISMNQFEAGKQVVPHLHAHIIPRFKDDGFKMWPNKKYESDGEKKDIQGKITRFLK